MWKPLEAGSSPVDWCEGNYLISPVIAEFVNTVSNVLFFLMPPVLMHLFRDYGRFVNPAIHGIWAMLMVVGASSAYFHATLSLIGQLLDECAILWVIIAGFAMFLPRRHFPLIAQNDRKKLSVGFLAFGIFATGLAVVHPAINAFVLMVLGIPALVCMVLELRRVNDGRVYRLGVRCCAVWLLSVSCWINDRLFCEVWSSLNFPYLHGLWHILIFIASYTVCVLFAYFSVKDEKPSKNPVLRYWPRNDFELGIPYVTIQDNPHGKEFCLGKDVYA
ncbi:Alkaline ceramidase [Frankliniella fusca]|uniref:Alkaline ceramidase n=1 Tax=Frankliniella fusca TaxID=407009 RepID=A0AAE1HKT3_9NEOP|nr:Alkaline ceramidase [Frankliniella fusca]